MVNRGNLYQRIKEIGEEATSEESPKRSTKKKKKNNSAGSCQKFKEEEEKQPKVSKIYPKLIANRKF